MDLTLCVLLLSLALAFSHLVSADFYSDFDITWGNDRAKVLDNGQHLQLTLDQSSGIFYLICLLLLYMCVLYSMMNRS